MNKLYRGYFILIMSILLIGILSLREVFALLKGDVNDDGIVDILDAHILGKYIIDGQSNISNEQLLLGDMTNDEIIKMNDVLLLINSINNPEVEGISLDQESGTVYLNDSDRTISLNATMNGSNINESVIWTSSNPDIATVLDGDVTALSPGVATITAAIADSEYEASFTLNVKKKVIIVIGASQVVRMDNHVSAYTSDNYSYTVAAGTLNYVELSGSGFDYQVGDGWSDAHEIMSSYANVKNNVEFYIFFPLSGNDIKSFNCSSITVDNETIIGYIDNYASVVDAAKSAGYNLEAYVVSMHPVKVSQSNSSYVVTNENTNACKVDYRSNRKYYQFNKTVESIINESYATSLNYEYLFEYIMTVNDEGNNYSYNVTYNTTDGIHWDKDTTIYYVNLMFDNIDLLQ